MLSSAPRKARKPSLLRDECTGTCVTLWTGHIRYKVGHFEIASPFSATWPAVEGEITVQCSKSLTTRSWQKRCSQIPEGQAMEMTEYGKHGKP